MAAAIFSARSNSGHEARPGAFLSAKADLEALVGFAHSPASLVRGAGTRMLTTYAGVRVFMHLPRTGL